MKRSSPLIRTRLNAYILILTPHPSDFRADEFWQLLKDLPGFSGKLNLPDSEGATWSQVSVSVFDGEDAKFVANADDRVFHELWLTVERSRAWYVLKITARASYTKKQAMASTKGWKAKKAERLGGYRLFLRASFEELLNDVVLVVNLARPGLFDVGEGYILQDGKVRKNTDVIISDLRMALANASKINWPQCHSLDLMTVWNWAMKTGLLGGIGKTALGRAFNAFSYLFIDPLDDQSVLLFWSLIGIEALYVSPSAKIMEQVRERSQLLLGPLTAYKKKLSRMYDLRSKFIHGALPFPGKFFTKDAMPEYEQFADEVSEASLLAQAILTATLQEMVIRDLSELSFSTVLNERMSCAIQSPIHDT